jgi:hypothetical protein
MDKAGLIPNAEAASALKMISFSIIALIVGTQLAGALVSN